MRFFSFFVLLAFCLPATATDLTLLLGYQANSDFRVSTAGSLPSGGSISQTDPPGYDLKLENGVVYGLAMDFEFNKNPNQRIGFYVSHQQSEFEDIVGLDELDMSVTHVQFTAMSYYPKGKMENFVMAGIGAAFYAPEDSMLRDETRLSAQIGAGTNYKFSDNLLLRMDVRWIPTFFNIGGAAFCSGGCVIRVKSELYSQFQVNVGLMYRY